MANSGLPGTSGFIGEFLVTLGAMRVSFWYDSHKPTSELLIPTVLSVSPPTDISVAKLTYPAGEDRSFPFSPGDKLPRTLGDTFLHVSRVHAFIETSHPLAEYPKHEISDLQRAIAGHVAPLIPDGATIQTGIGGIPEAVLGLLRDHKDLGIHSEMVPDSVVELIQSGVINNERKTIHPHKVIAGFVLGSRMLFDFIDNNPVFEFHRTAYANDPFIIAQNDRMVALNSAIEVDLTGQVCADSMGQVMYSGIGGQVDFLRGAARSKGGMPISTLPSTAKNGEVSRIVPRLQPGAGVVTSRGDVHYVITEHGVAYLHGKTLRQRAEALIRVADPKFREELEEFARENKILGAGRSTVAV